MNKWHIITVSVCLSGWAQASLTLDLTNMETNGTAQITQSGLLDSSTGNSVDVTMNGQGPDTDKIVYTAGQGYGVHGGTPWTAALNSNETLSFTFSEKVELSKLSMTGISASEAVAWWIDSGTKTIIAGSKNNSLGSIELDAGQVFNVQAYVDGITYNDTKIYLESLEVNVIPEPATLGLIGMSGAMILFARRLMM